MDGSGVTLGYYVNLIISRPLIKPQVVFRSAGIPSGISHVPNELDSRPRKCHKSSVSANDPFASCWKCSHWQWFQTFSTSNWNHLKWWSAHAAYFYVHDTEWSVTICSPFEAKVGGSLCHRLGGHSVSQGCFRPTVLALLHNWQANKVGFDHRSYGIRLRNFAVYQLTEQRSYGLPVIEWIDKHRSGKLGEDTGRKDMGLINSHYLLWYRLHSIHANTSEMIWDGVSRYSTRMASVPGFLQRPHTCIWEQGDSFFCQQHPLPDFIPILQAD